MSGARVAVDCPDHGQVIIRGDDPMVYVEGDFVVFSCGGDLDRAQAHRVTRRTNEKGIAMLTGIGIRRIDDVIKAETADLENDQDIWRAVLA